MKCIFTLIALFCFVARAQNPYIPLSPTQYQPPEKSDDVLPIAPMRTDDRIEMPEVVFSSVKGDDKWEKFERGDDPNDKRTVMIADKKSSDKKQNKKVASKKGKVDNKGKVAKQSSNKRKPAGLDKNAKTKNNKVKNNKPSARKPAAKKTKK